MADDKQAEQAAREITANLGTIYRYTMVHELRDFRDPRARLLKDADEYIGGIISKHYASKLEAAEKMAEALKRAENELQEIVAFAIIERAALRDQELKSIKAVRKANAAALKAWESTL